MEKRLKHYLKLYKSISEQNLSPEEVELRIKSRENINERFLAEMLTRIGFYQHERLIHLIVTVLFAVLTVMTLFACLLIIQPVLFALELLLLVLLVPYIRHYYILENGTQKLYEYYDTITGKCN